MTRDCDNGVSTMQKSPAPPAVTMTRSCYCGAPDLVYLVTPDGANVVTPDGSLVIVQIP